MSKKYNDFSIVKFGEFGEIFVRNPDSQWYLLFRDKKLGVCAINGDDFINDVAVNGKRVKFASTPEIESEMITSWTIEKPRQRKLLFKKNEWRHASLSSSMLLRESIIREISKNKNPKNYRVVKGVVKNIFNENLYVDMYIIDLPFSVTYIYTKAIDGLVPELIASY